MTAGNAIEKLKQAMQHAMQHRPKVGGFPYLAETLRMASVMKYVWSLPSCQAMYVMKEGNVISQGTALISGFAEVPQFDREALVRALRASQSGESDFPAFLVAAWQAGVVRYEVDLEKRTVTYSGALGDSYVEAYPAVELKEP